MKKKLIILGNENKLHIKRKNQYTIFFVAFNIYIYIYIVVNHYDNMRVWRNGSASDSSPGG
jgi:hypothetical protein